MELLYLRARYYRPEVGRFVSRDPLQGDHLQPQTLNSFVYVTNNAVNRVDPSGQRGTMPWPHYLTIMFGGNQLCPEAWFGELDLMDKGVRSIIERNFGPGGDLDPYFSRWVNYGPSHESLPYYDLNRYDKIISGWVDLFNEILLKQWDKKPVNPSVIKAMVMRESKMGIWMGTGQDYENGIMQVTLPARKDVQKWDVPGARARVFYFGPGVLDVNFAADPSLGVAAGARYFFNCYMYDAPLNLWSAVWYYNRGGDPHYVSRVAEVYNRHLYSWYQHGIEFTTCVGPKCTEEWATHPQPYR